MGLVAKVSGLRINDLVAGTPDGAADFFAFYDTSDNDEKKVLGDNLPGGGSLPTTTKGDVIVHNGTTDVRLAVGSNDQVLIADSAKSEGVKWGAVAGTGDVVGPSIGVTDNRICRFDTTTGKLIQGSPLGVNDQGDFVDSSGNEVLQISEALAAVNHIQIGNAASGGFPFVAAGGDDTNVALALQGKGTGNVDIYSGDSNIITSFRRTASAVNRFEMLQAATGTGPSFTATGSDTNVDMLLLGKATGALKWNGTEIFDSSANLASAPHSMTS